MVNSILEWIGRIIFVFREEYFKMNNIMVMIFVDLRYLDINCKNLVRFIISRIFVRICRFVL